MNPTIGHLTAVRAASILAGCRAPDPITWRGGEAEAYLVHVLKTAGATAHSFEAISRPFHTEPIDCRGVDAWDVLAFAVGELLSADHNQWALLRERYYVNLREQRIGQGDGE